MKKLPILLLAAAIVALPLSCTKDQDKPADEKNDAAYYVKVAQMMLAEDETDIEFRGPAVTVPAGSHNALQAAIAQAGNNGTVILATGNHTEDNTVNITHKVKITGQTGTVLIFDSDPSQTFPFVTDPGFHIKNANQVIIEKLDIQDADGLGSMAVLIEGSNQTRVRNNTMTGFQIAIAQYQSNNTSIHDNEINGVVALQGPGILNVSGKNLKIYDNSVHDNTIDIFLSDDGGLVKGNHLSSTGNIGILFCTPNVGGVYLVLPNGDVVAASISANNWLALQNYSENHLFNYLVIDNASKNKLVQNDAANAVLYDIEMAGDSERFGFFTPTSFDNLVISTAHPHVNIKVCGENNQAIGGTHVDTGADPCF